MTTWRDVPVVIVRKVVHIRKIGGKVYHSFIRDLAEMPVGDINPITHQLEPAVNHRGWGYALRNALRYRPNKKKGTR